MTGELAARPMEEWELDRVGLVAGDVGTEWLHRSRITFDGRRVLLEIGGRRYTAAEVLKYAARALRR